MCLNLKSNLRYFTTVTNAPIKSEKLLWSWQKSFNLIKGSFAFLSTVATIFLAVRANQIASDNTDQQRQLDILIKVAQQLQHQDSLSQGQISELKLLNASTLNQLKSMTALLESNRALFSLNQARATNDLAEGRENLYRALEKIEGSVPNGWSMDGLLNQTKEDRYAFLKSVLPIYERELSNSFVITDDSLFAFWETFPRQVRACISEIDSYYIPTLASVNGQNTHLMTLQEKEQHEKYIFNAYLIIYNMMEKYLRKNYPSKRKGPLRIKNPLSTLPSSR